MRVIGACAIALVTIGMPAQACPFHEPDLYEAVNYEAPQRYAPFAPRGQPGATPFKPDAPTPPSEGGEQADTTISSQRPTSRATAPPARSQDEQISQGDTQDNDGDR